MRLELVSRRPAGTPRPTPLLFVHGSYSGAWVWERHFLPFFAAEGYEAHAVSLRGHGASEGRDRLWTHRLRDYVADVERVADALSGPPVLIGHSMGGMVVQKALHRRRVPASVLMAPVPPHGLLGSALGIALGNPWLYHEMALAQALGPRAASAAGTLRRALFSDGAPEESVRYCFERLQPESSLVVLDLLGLDLPPSRPALDVPVLVLGAGRDGFVFPGGLAATARTYRTRPEVFPGMAHAMMLDRGWEAVARRILDWLGHTLGA